MSKRLFKRITALCRVQAVPSRVARNSKGEVVYQWYDIYGPARMKRN